MVELHWEGIVLLCSGWMILFLRSVGRREPPGPIYFGVFLFRHDHEGVVRFKTVPVVATGDLKIQMVVLRGMCSELTDRGWVLVEEKMCEANDATRAAMRRLL